MALKYFCWHKWRSCFILEIPKPRFSTRCVLRFEMFTKCTHLRMLLFLSKCNSLNNIKVRFFTTICMNHVVKVHERYWLCAQFVEREDIGLLLAWLRYKVWNLHVSITFLNLSLFSIFCLCFAWLLWNFLTAVSIIISLLNVM